MKKKTMSLESIDTIRESIAFRAMMPINTNRKVIRSKFGERLEQLNQGDELIQLANDKNSFKIKRQSYISDIQLAQGEKDEANWKILFKKKLQRSKMNRKNDFLGCRPGWFCHKKTQKCLLKDCYIKEIKYSIPRSKMAAKIKDQYAQDFLNRHNISKVIEQISQSYDYLKSMDYSERKISQLVKSYCENDLELLFIFLKPNIKQETHQHYFKDKEIILRNIIMVASKNKNIQQIQEFYYRVKQYKVRLEDDAVQRGKTVARMIGTCINKTKKELQKHQFRLTFQSERKNNFLNTIQKLQLRCGQLDRITSLNRKRHSVLSAQEIFQDSEYEQF